MSVTLEHYLVVSAILFGIGLWIALAKHNAIIILMGIELMLNAVNLMLVAFNRFIPQTPEAPRAGHVFVIFIITVAAAEAAVALALAVSVYRTRNTVDVDRIDLLKF